MRNHKGTKITKIFFLIFVSFVSLWFYLPSTTTTIQIPAGESLLYIRFGKRKSPSGTLQTHIGFLTEEKTEGGIPSFSYLRTFVPGRDEPLIEIKKENPDRYTNFSFVDFAGDGDQYLACFTVKSQVFPKER